MPMLQMQTAAGTSVIALKIATSNDASVLAITLTRPEHTTVGVSTNWLNGNQPPEPHVCKIFEFRH
jgi:hypothetical protein